MYLLYVCTGVNEWRAEQVGGLESEVFEMKLTRLDETGETD